MEALQAEEAQGRRDLVGAFAFNNASATFWVRPRIPPLLADVGIGIDEECGHRDGSIAFWKGTGWVLRDYCWYCELVLLRAE